MGLFTSSFSSKAPQQLPGREKVVFLLGLGNFDLEILGTAHFQAALENICGPRLSDGVKRLETAGLILEDKNPRDKNAVRVEIRRKPVGYLSREVASLYRQQLEARGTPNAAGQCQAVIRGGWVSSDGRKGPYQVWLDIPISYQ